MRETFEVPPLDEKLLAFDECWEGRVSFLHGCGPGQDAQAPVDWPIHMHILTILIELNG